MNATIQRFEVKLFDWQGQQFKTLCACTPVEEIELDVNAVGDGQKTMGDICATLGEFVACKIGIDGFIDRISLECTAFESEYVATATYVATDSLEQSRYIAHIPKQ